MRRFITLAGLVCTLIFSAQAQTTTTPAFPFTYYVHDTTGTVADYPLPSPYQFAATPMGSSSHIVLKVVNTSSAPAFMGTVFVGTAAGLTVQNANFSVTGLALSITVPAAGSLLFQVNFTPDTTGVISAYLETSYQIQQGSCIFTSTDPNTQCPSGLNSATILNGTATQPQLVLSYSGSTTPLQPSSSPVNFGNISPGQTSPLTFTLSNESAVALTIPAISLTQGTVYVAGAFVLDTSQLPSSGSIAAGASANFTVTFEPGQGVAYVASLLVGSNVYPIEGIGEPSTPVNVADISSLSVCYVDNTGNQTPAEPSSAIPFSLGSVTGANTLTFMVMNPATSPNAVSVPAITVSGAFSISSFSMSSGPLTTGICPVPTTANRAASTLPASIPAGYGLVFTITYVPTTYGTSTGTLTIGSSSPMQAFQFAGTNSAPLVSDLSLTVTPSPLTSQQQASVTVNLSTAASVTLTGTIALAFAPSVINVTTDPAVIFLANNTLQLPISIASGAQVATYTDSAGKAQSAIAFQSGTTAGTLTFTVTFPNTPVYTQSFTITPAQVQLSSATAVVQSSQILVVNMTGYDNTYSAGALNFTFYDTSGNPYPAIAYNAAAAFQSNFFSSSNTTGGAFTLQANFPVTGDITKIGSVALSIGNSVGQTSQTVTVTQ